MARLVPIRLPDVSLGRNMEKLILLIWKDFLLQLRHPIQTLIEILAPVLFTVLLVILRSLIPPEHEAAVFYTPFENHDLNTTSLRLLKTIAWSPQHPSLNAIMDDTVKALKVKNKHFNFKHVGFNNKENLSQYLSNDVNMVVTMAGIQFDDGIVKQQRLPSRLNVTFRKSCTAFSNTCSGCSRKSEYDTNESFPDLYIQKSNDSEARFESGISGRRIVDIKHLFSALTSLNHSGFNCSFFDIDIVDERRFGFKSIFTTRCKVCNIRNTFSTEKENSIDINQAAVCGIIAIGTGYTQLRELCSSLDIPVMSFNTYASKESVLQKTIKETFLEEMKLAGTEELHLAREAGDIDDAGTAVISVIVDGAWCKRSYKKNYNALSGVACIVGIRTKKILFLGIKNKYCCMCQRYTSLGREIPEHKCFKNWKDSSTSMEPAIIVEGFKQFIEMHQLKYGKMIGDGDSSVYKRLCEIKPYGANLFIEMIECKNHILRNYCNKISELSKNTKLQSEVRIFLRNNIIKFRVAISSAVKYYIKQDIPVAEKIKKLKEDTLNSPKHIFGVHDNCKQYFCKNIKLNAQHFLYDLENSHMYNEFYRHLHRVASHASSLLQNVDTNYAENLNSMVNKLIGGKRVNYSLRGSYETRCNAAIINVNKKRSFLEATPLKLGRGVIGKYTQKYCTSRKRVYKKKPILKRISAGSNADMDYGDLENEIEDKSLSEISEKQIKHMKEIFNVDVIAVEILTRGQRNNPQWFKEILSRLTGSYFGQVCKMKPKTNTANLVKKILYSNPNIKHNAMEYGNLNEEKAISYFQMNTGFIVQNCGLFIHPEKSYLAASADGIISADTIVEVKCFFSAREMSIVDGIEKKVISFCTSFIDDNGTL